MIAYNLMGGGFLAIILMCTANMAASQVAVDYAEPKHVDDWLRHPVIGDPSFDAFVHHAGNPVHRGAPPLEWPVNGFLFEDPPSGDWFIYVGHYAQGYAVGPGKTMVCTVYRSKDRGRTWTHLGPIFPDDPFTFEGDTSPVGYAPDVSVVYADGRYHMVYDWATTNSTWETMANPIPGTDSGIGYAWAERPEGPFQRTSPPVYRTSAYPAYLGKYRRGYAASLIRRKHDWLVLAMNDSGLDFGWALVGMTAKNPEGPYSQPVFLRCVDDMYFHPPLLEFYPAFTHRGWIYAPATSVALNRNFQALFRVRVEDAMNSAAWELYRYGSLWHSDPVPHEHYGLWGQTFSGFVSKEGTLNVMFPSRDPDGFGTINVASRPWRRPYADRGFVISGHQGSSLALLKRAYTDFELSAELTVHGDVAVVWGHPAPIGPDRPASDATLHPLCLSDRYALELSGARWKIVQYRDSATPIEVASGELSPTENCYRIRLSHTADSLLTISINDRPTWSGHVLLVEGPVGILAKPNSRAAVHRFEIAGTRSNGRCSLLFTEGILGAGAAKDSWKNVEGPEFHYGKGAVSTRPSARAKWNFEGTGFTLWAPKGPQYGAAELFVDGNSLGTADFAATGIQASQPLLSRRDLKNAFHALVMVANKDQVPLDTLEIEF
ncbi:MAG: hypothetical protein HY706_18340 [Candidatus Hydrogenedentes bacterium]|nr:hypothetical protein [Candidatus Hydrogenedentota bacterium]